MSNPFPIAFAALTSPNAIAWYRATAVEVMLCFVEGLVILMAGTCRLGQLAHIALYNLGRPV